MLIICDFSTTLIIMDDLHLRGDRCCCLPLDNLKNNNVGGKLWGIGALEVIIQEEISRDMKYERK